MRLMLLTRQRIPLRRLALCLNDEMAFDLAEGARCPACGSPNFALIERLLNHDTTACPWTGAGREFPTSGHKPIPCGAVMPLDRTPSGKVSK